MLNNNIIENLLTLLNIKSYSKEESDVAIVITELLEKLNFKFNIDGIGNIFATRGEAELYPMFNAHMDSVKGSSYSYTSSYSEYKNLSCENCFHVRDCYGVYGYQLQTEYKDFFCDDFKKQSYYKYVDEKKPEKDSKSKNDNGIVATISDDGKKIEGNGSRPIGGDDKCGIAMALQIAIERPDMPMKLFFSVQEEIGCIGSSHAVNTNRSFFEDVVYCITIDRRGNRDLCLSSCGGANGRKSFMRQLSDAYWAVGIIPNYVDGASADCVKLREVIYDCVNVSCGYHDPHTNKETVVISDFLNLYAMINHFVDNYKMVEDIYTLPYVEKKTTSVTVFKDTEVLKKNKEKNKEQQETISDYCKTNKTAIKYYNNKKIIEKRNEILRQVKTLRENNYKGIKVYTSLELNYEDICDILEFVMPEVYNSACRVKLSGKSEVNYGYLAIKNGELCIVMPIVSEVNNEVWLNNEKLGLMFYNLFW